MGAGRRGQEERQGWGADCRYDERREEGKKGGCGLLDREEESEM